MVVCSLIISITSLALSSSYISSNCHGFPLIEQVSSPTRELLVAAKVCLLLLYPLGYCAMLATELGRTVGFLHHLKVLIVSVKPQKLILGKRHSGQFQEK